MSTIAARKLRTVLANAQAVVAIELLVAAQAIDWRVGMRRDPNPHTPDDDQPGFARGTMSVSDEEATAFAEATQPDRREQTAAVLGAGTGAAYRAVRDVAAPMLADRVLEPDIRAVRRIIETGTLLAQVNVASDTPLRPIPPLVRGGR